MRRMWGLIPLLLLGVTARGDDRLAFGRAQRSVSSTRDAGFIPASANGEDARAAELARIQNDDEFTLYELLGPDSHRFVITYDVAAEREGDRYFLNPIREGSIATDERIVDRATGKPLRFELVKGAIKVELAKPVPRDGARRIRIFKTYADPKSYYGEGDRIVFDRGLSIRRNAVVLPAGYELVSCSVPAIVSTESDGRVKASFVNDRDDVLPVKIVGRRLPAAGSTR